MTEEEARREARRRYQRKGEIEIDEGAAVSVGAGGCWVAAWCWLPDSEVSVKQEGRDSE